MLLGELMTVPRSLVRWGHPLPGHHLLDIRRHVRGGGALFAPLVPTFINVPARLCISNKKQQKDNKAYFGSSDF